MKSLLRENFVQKLGSFFKTVPVVVAAVEVQLQVRELLGMLRQRQWAIGFKIGFVKRRAEWPLQDAGVESPPSLRGNRVGKLGQQRRALGAGSSEHVWMSHA